MKPSCSVFENREIMLRLSKEQKEYLKLVIWKMLFSLRNNTMSDECRTRIEADMKYIKDVCISGEYNVNQKMELNRISYKWKKK